MNSKTDILASSVNRIAPSGWTGPLRAALYHNFDHTDGLVLMEGSTQTNSITFEPGKVKN